MIGVAQHEETLEQLVIYLALYGEEVLWLRSLSVFVETVMIEGKEVSRFRYVGE